jgi:type II secretion system protein D
MIKSVSSSFYKRPGALPGGRWAYWNAGLLAVALSLPGCARPPGGEFLPKAVVVSQATRTDENLGFGGAASRPGASYGAAPAINLAAAAPVVGQADVSLNFADTDIRIVIAQILGTILQQPYTIDPAVQGTATLNTAAPLARDALIPVLQTLLAQNNAVLLRPNGVYRVVPADQAATLLNLAGDTALGGTVVVPLRYAQAAPLAEILEPYITAATRIGIAPDQNALLVTGDPSSRHALVSIIQAFDTDELAGQSYEMFPVTGGDAESFAAAFAAALGQSSDPNAAGPVRVLPLERMNAVLVIARSPNMLASAQRVYGVLNQVERQTRRSWYVYDLHNGRADDAAEVLRRAFTADNVAGQGGTMTGIRVIPDNAHNALLIYASAAEDARVNAMLGRIDTAPAEVRIDAIIAEVDLDGALQYGTQFFFKSGGMNGLLSAGDTASLAPGFPGFVLSGNGTDAAPVAISLLQSVTKVNVLSSPQLMVMDGHVASLQVGNLVPYLSQTSQSTVSTGAPVINSVDYRQTGVILQITPHVGSTGMVTLDVAQEISGVQPAAATAGVHSPTFTERAVTSRVGIQDGQTVGLAGLISDSDSHQNQGVPYLKNVPLLGDLTGGQNNQRARTELLVLITPHVIRTKSDAADLTADLRAALPDAAAVPDETLPSQLPH